MIKVVVLGAGNVAHHLIPAIQNSSVAKVVQQYSRSFSKNATSSIPQISNIDDVANADVYIICIPDDAIASFSAKLPKNKGLVVHTSGSVPISAIDSKHNKGVLYPLQSFSKNRSVNMQEVPFCLEVKDEKHFKMLKTLANGISNHTHTINSKQRKALHLAAVFVNNFTNHIYKVGEDICKESNVPFNILQPLIKETAAKIEALSPSEAQTGPAKRNDINTITKQLDALQNDTHKEIYALLTKSIQESYGKKL